MNLKPTIGIETHIELNTNTKMFCRCKVVDTEEPNISLCPTCIGSVSYTHLTLPTSG